MLDLYERDAILSDSVKLFQKLISLFYSGPIEDLSIAEKVLTDFDVDLTRDPDGVGALSRCLQTAYQESDGEFSSLFSRWMSDEVEPRSVNKCLVVKDFPYAAETRAKLKNGTTGIADRVEFLIRGVEVVHLYQDDPDLLAFADRAKRYGHFGPEDDIICKLIESGVVPRHSSGGAIGLERLCAACLGLRNIYGLLLAPEFLSRADIPPHLQHALGRE